MNGDVKVIALVLIFLVVEPVFAIQCNFRSQNELAQEVLQELEVDSLSCNKQKVHITFDDGPSASTTPLIMKELNSRGVKATFFVTTTNLEPSHKNHRQNSAALREVINSGHLIASHGHQHSSYDLRMSKEGTVQEKGFNQAEREREISKSVSLLNEASGNKFNSQPFKLFRFPYGRGAMPSAQELARMRDSGLVQLSASDYAGQLAEYRTQSPALLTIAGHGFSHLGWNHDSNDSSFGMGMPERSVLKNYIRKNLKNLCAARSSRVALFHDIKQMNTVALPVIIDIGRCLGLSFVSASEIMAEKDGLARSGVLLRKEGIERAPVESIAKLFSSIEKTGPIRPQCDQEKAKECYSEQYHKRYGECEGGSSICLGGRWYSRRDQLVIMNCNLAD